jgi:hypothetical protein
MTIPARVIGRSFKAAGVTFLKMASKGSSAAHLNCMHDLEMRKGKGMGTTVLLSIETKDVCNLWLRYLF